MRRTRAFLATPEVDLTFQILLPPSAGASVGADGFSGMVVKPWNQRHRTVAQIQPEVQGRLSKIPGLQIFAATPAALPGGSNFPIEFVIASTAGPEQLLEFAQKIQAKAMQSGIFYFPPLIDLKIDQPQAELVIDREIKTATLGPQPDAGRRRPRLGLGRAPCVNRFNIDGRSYKVIPQLQRGDRLNPDQLREIYVTGPNGQLVPLSTVATIQNKTVPRSLNRFQQLNAVKLSGQTSRTLDESLKVLEDAAREILPPGYSIDYTGESRQLRQEGNKFLPALAVAIVLIFLALAVQFQLVPRPARDSLLGSVPLAMFGALIFHGVEDAQSQPAVLDEWLDHHDEHIYAQVGLVTLVGLVAKNGILIVEFANKLQEAEQEQARGDPGGGDDPSAASVLMTSVATVGPKPFPPDTRHRRWRRGAKLDWPGCWSAAADHRDDLHAVCRAVDLHPAGERPLEKPCSGGRGTRFALP